jgi:hypothetical protein
MINGVLVLLFAYLISMPFYVLPSGLPQPSDLVLSVAFALFWTYCAARARVTLHPTLRQLTLVVLLFVTYVVAVGLCSTAAVGDVRIALYPLFYLFNFLAFLLVLSLYSSEAERSLATVALGVLISLYLQTVLSLFLQGINEEGERQVAFFNNPNQLGYYALLSASVLAIAREYRALSRTAYLTGMLCAVWLCALALSKAALVAIAVLLLIETSRKRVDVPLLLGAILATIAVSGAVDLVVLENVIARLQDIGAASDDSAAGRGYNRIWLYPQHLIFGAGEGAFYRFSGTNNGEIHSTFGTILFSYGVVGAAIFGLASLLVLLQVRLSRVLYLAPAALYGITHNGLRDTLVWVLLALVLALGQRRTAPLFGGARGPVDGPDTALQRST